MAPEWSPIALGVVAALLVAYVVFAGIAPMLRRRRESAPARARMSRSISEGSDAARSTSERARSFRTASKTALEELHRPRLAARYAEWAHRLDPTDDEVIALAVLALTASRRYHALERLLWTSLAMAENPRRSPALAALETLYERHLARSDRAKVLRALGGATASPTDAA